MNPQDPGQATAQPQPTIPSTPPQPSSEPPAPLPAVPPQSGPDPAAVQPASLAPAVKPKSKMRLLIIVAAVIVVLLVASLAAMYFYMQSEKSAGLKKAQDFVALLETNDSEGAINEIYKMTGIDPDATTTIDELSSENAQEALGAIAQASQLSQLLQEDGIDAKLYDSSFGVTQAKNGDKMVTAYFSVTIDSGRSGYYTVQTAKKDGAWQLHAVEFSTTKPTTSK